MEFPTLLEDSTEEAQESSSLNRCYHPDAASTGLNSGFDPVDDMPWQRIIVNKIFTEHAATYQ